MNDALQELAEQLSSEDPFVREASVQELAELEDPEAAPLLLRAIDDAEETVRRAAVHGLARLGRPEDAPTLRRVLEKDPVTLVRIQAALGLARLDESSALEKLIEFLEGPAWDVRHEAAEALLTLPQPNPLLPRLRARLATRDERTRAWIAGVLHTLGDPEAFGEWHTALATPESRRDAVSVALLMREDRATRELIRLVAELSQDELTAAEKDEPILAELVSDALRMTGAELLLGATDSDEALRADLLILLGRYQHLVPELLDDIVQYLARHPAEELGAQLAQLLSEQERGERGPLFRSIATLFTELALPTLKALEEEDREEALEAVVKAAEEADGEDPALNTLVELLMDTSYGERFESLPTEPPTREQSIPTEAEEAEDEEEWLTAEPPAADAVAQRVLAVGALLRRHALEERLARKAEPAAKEEIQQLQKWMEEEGLYSPLGLTGMELFEAEPGAWSEEDRQTVAWSAEELHLLLWALRQGKLPPTEARVEAAPLLERLPLLKDPQAFLDSAERRPLEEVEAQRERWRALLQCARYESFARGIIAEPELAEGDPELDALLQDAEEEGFDRNALEEKLGLAKATVEGLRFWARRVVTALQEEGLLPGKPGEGLVFQGKRLSDMDEPTLAWLLGLAHARHQALEWLAEGDEGTPDEGDDDEPG